MALPVFSTLFSIKITTQSFVPVGLSFLEAFLEKSFVNKIVYNMKVTVSQRSSEDSRFVQQEFFSSEKLTHRCILSFFWQDK